MRPIPTKLRRQIAADPFMKTCCTPDEKCKGRIEWDHVMKYAGKQVNETWSIVPLCIYHHRGGGLDRPRTEYLALSRATMKDLEKYPKATARWEQRLKWLKTIYE